MYSSEQLQVGQLIGPWTAPSPGLAWREKGFPLACPSGGLVVVKKAGLGGVSARQGGWTRSLGSFCWLKGSAQVSPMASYPIFVGEGPPGLYHSPQALCPPVLLGCALMGLWTITSLSKHQSSVPGPTTPHTFLSSRVYDQGGHAHQAPTSSFRVFSGRRGSCCQGHDHGQTSRPRGPAQAR